MVADSLAPNSKFVSCAFTSTLPVSAVTETSSPFAAILKKQAASDAVQVITGTLGEAGLTTADDNAGITSSGAAAVDRHQISPRRNSMRAGECTTISVPLFMRT